MSIKYRTKRGIVPNLIIEEVLIVFLVFFSDEVLAPEPAEVVSDDRVESSLFITEDG
jgi:hypothetical protein